MSTEPTHFPHCPYCEAEWASNGYYVCGTFNNNGCHDTFPQSALCRERAAHAATKRELEEMTLKFSDAENRVIGGGYAAQMLRRHCGLDDTKEDLMEVAEAFEKLQSRVRELEGLVVGYSGGTSADGAHFKIYIPTERVQDFEDDWEPETLGEAMPRREEK